VCLNDALIASAAISEFVPHPIKDPFKRVAIQYLRLLGIAQTCRFQRKSFLAFLLSGEKDIDWFMERRLPKATQLVGSEKYAGGFIPDNTAGEQKGDWNIGDDTATVEKEK
jgi:hypothetical protein